MFLYDLSLDTVPPQTVGKSLKIKSGSTDIDIRKRISINIIPASRSAIERKKAGEKVHNYIIVIKNAPQQSCGAFVKRMR